MDHRCAEPLELAALLALPTDDERRREAVACPRCDSLLRELAAFLDGDAALPDAERIRSERHLAGALAGAMAARTARSAPVAASVDGARSFGRSRRGQSGWRWGLGLAAAAAGVVFIVAREPLAPAGPSGVLRGGSRAASAAAELAVTVTAGGRDGQVLLAWPAVAGADSYLVELFSAELDTLAVFGPLSEPTLAVDAARLRGEGHGPGAAADVLCRVRALGRDGELAASRLAGLTLP
jgi:hypothetical protein